MSRIALCSGLLFCLIAVTSKGQVSGNYTLPETWTEDFVITLSYYSSMSGGKTELKLTFDSCIYFNQSFHTENPSQGYYPMKAADRVAILKKLKELKADQIKSESSVHVVRDGWSQSICFNSYCIDGGTSSEMSEQDKNLFLDAYRYLETFVMKKTRRDH